MEPSRPRIVLLLAGVVLCGGLVSRIKPPSRSSAIASTDRPSVVNATPSPAPSDTGDDETANREEIRALFPTPRPARPMPDLSSLLALADRWEELIDLLGTLSDRQCLQAYAQLQTRPTDGARDEVLRALLTSFARQGRHVSLARLMSMTDPEFAREIWNDMPDFNCSLQWTDFKGEETARWLLDHGGEFASPEKRSEKIARAITSWGNDDPRAAAEFTGNLPSGLEGSPEPRGLFSDVAEQWGQSDLPAALAWAEALPSGDGRRTAALIGLIDAMANDNPARARRYLEQQIGTDKDTVKLAEEVASRTAYEHEETARWAFSLSDADTRRGALRGLVEGWMEGSTSDDQVRAGTTPPAAQWAESLPASDARGAVWSAVAENWGDLHPDNAKSWLLRLPAGEDRSGAVTAYDQAIVSTAKDLLAHGEAEKALDMTCKYPFDRQFAAEQQFALLVTWADQDAAAAHRWAVEHGISKPAVGTRGR